MELMQKKLCLKAKTLNTTFFIEDNRSDQKMKRKEKSIVKHIINIMNISSS